LVWWLALAPLAVPWLSLLAKPRPVLVAMFL